MNAKKQGILPISGREEEIEFLLSKLGRALSGSGSLVLIAGEAGIGKTRLCEEFMELASSLGCLTIMGRCLPGPSVPNLPFVDAFRSLDLNCLQSGNRVQLRKTIQDINELFSEVERAPSTFSVEYAQENLLFLILSALERLAEKSPSLLILEDLHWADSSSLQLLHFLARNISDKRLMIIGTYRPEDLIEVEEHQPERRTAVKQYLMGMRAEGVFNELLLGPLDKDELGLAFNRLLNGPVDEWLIERIAEESEGNPLFALETIRLLASSEVIRKVDGLWRVEKGVDFKVPSSIKEIILRRLERLNSEEKKLLDCASVIGDQFSPQVIVSALGLEEEEVLGRLESIAWNSYLIKKLEVDYRFSHEKIRRLNYERLSQALRKELHRRVGLILEELPHDDRILGQLSTHFYESRMDEKCIEYSILAGKRFISHYAGGDALIYFNRAIERLEKTPEETYNWRESIEGLGDSYYQVGDYRKAFEQYDELQKAILGGNERARLLRKCADCWMPQKLGEGSGLKHAEYLQMAMQCKDVSRREWAEILRDAAVEAAWRGDFENDDKMSREAIGILEEEGDYETAAWEMAIHGFSLTIVGRNREAVEELREAKKFFEERPWPRGEIETALNLGQALIMLGQEEEAIGELNRCLLISTKLGDFYSASWSYLNISIIEGFRGEAAKAMMIGEKARKIALMSGNKNLVAMSDAFLIAFSLRLCNFQRAKECKDEMDSIVTQYDLDLKSPLWGITKVARSYYDFLVGDSFSSEVEFGEGLDMLEGVQVGYFYKAIGLTWWAEALRQKGLIELSKHKYEECISQFDRMSNSKQVGRIQKMMSSMED